MGDNRVPRELQNKKVWASLLTNTSYLTGLLTLRQSLLDTKTRYQFFVIYTPTLPSHIITLLTEDYSIPCIPVSAILPSKSKKFENEPRFVDTWSKLAVFSLTQFDTIVLLDGDMLVRRNMDELMDLDLDGPEMEGSGNRVFAATHACVCNPRKKPHYPKEWIPENCAYTQQHADPTAAQTTSQPSTFGLGLLNSGLLVVKPSEAVFRRILTQLEAPVIESYSFPDQDLLSDVYHGRWVGLPYVYNALRTLREEDVHVPIWRDDDVKNVHYILAPKPWDDKDSQEEVVKWWRAAEVRPVGS